MSAAYSICVTWEERRPWGIMQQYALFGADDINAGIVGALALRPVGAETWIEIVEAEKP